MSNRLFELADEATLSVTELQKTVARAVDGAFTGQPWVSGEISGLKRSAVGHVYFDLVDPDRPGTVLPVALLKPQRASVNTTLKRNGPTIRMADGLEVRIRGKVQHYERRSQVQLKMFAIDPVYTLGRIAEDRDLLLAALSAEGLLGRNAELATPLFPLHIALITSVGSAAYEDFMAELRASGLSWRVTVIDSRVQGHTAHHNVANALAKAQRTDAEVIALVRGGGAKTDLAAFDHELIARAIAGCSVAVWCGIGHEIDTSVADHVAHSAFKTPTATAAALVERAKTYLAECERAWVEISHHAGRIIGAADQSHQRIAADVSASSSDGIGRAENALAHATAAISHRSRSRLDASATSLEHLQGSITSTARRRLTSEDAQLASTGARIARTAPRATRAPSLALDAIASQIHALDPRRIMARGWGLTRDAEGGLVRSVSDVSPGEPLTIELIDGQLDVTAVTVTPQ